MEKEQRGIEVRCGGVIKPEDEGSMKTDGVEGPLGKACSDALCKQ